jgi:hypothetical protein
LDSHINYTFSVSPIVPTDQFSEFEFDANSTLISEDVADTLDIYNTPKPFVLNKAQLPLAMDKEEAMSNMILAFVSIFVIIFLAFLLFCFINKKKTIVNPQETKEPESFEFPLESKKRTRTPKC